MSSHSITLLPLGLVTGVLEKADLSYGAYAIQESVMCAKPRRTLSDCHVGPPFTEPSTSQSRQWSTGHRDQPLWESG